MFTLPSLEELATVKEDHIINKASLVGKLSGEIIGNLVISLKEAGVDHRDGIAIAIDSTIKIMTYLLACPDSEAAVAEIRQRQKESILTNILLSTDEGTKH